MPSAGAPSGHLSQALACLLGWGAAPLCDLRGYQARGTVPPFCTPVLAAQAGCVAAPERAVMWPGELALSICVDLTKQGFGRLVTCCWRWRVAVLRSRRLVVGMGCTRSGSGHMPGTASVPCGPATRTGAFAWAAAATASPRATHVSTFARTAASISPAVSAAFSASENTRSSSFRSAMRDRPDTRAATTG